MITLSACHLASDRRGGTPIDQALAVAAYQRSKRAFAYGDLLNADGSCNVAAFHWILARRIAADINVALCVAAGMRCPRNIPFGGATTEWRAKATAGIDPALVSPAERERIAEHHGAEMLELVAVMQRAATQERERQMPRQHQIAAE